MPSKTAEDWRAELNALLEQAKAASEADDGAARLRLCDKLLSFVDRSDPRVAGTDELDAIALKAHRTLAADVVDRAVAGIRARTAEIATLTKDVERVAAAAEASARALTLEKAHAAVDALTAATRAVKGLAETGLSGTDAELRARLAALLKALEDGRRTIEKSKGG